MERAAPEDAAPQRCPRPCPRPGAAGSLWPLSGLAGAERGGGRRECGQGSGAGPGAREPRCHGDGARAPRGRHGGAVRGAPLRPAPSLSGCWGRGCSGSAAKPSSVSHYCRRFYRFFPAKARSGDTERLRVSSLNKCHGVIKDHQVQLSTYHVHAQALQKVPVVLLLKVFVLATEHCLIAQRMLH